MSWTDADERLLAQKMKQEAALREEEEKIRLSTNPIYYPLYNNKSRYLVLYGGAGSGKSIFVGQKIVNKIKCNKLCNYLIIRQTGKTNRISTFPLIRQTINKLNLSKDFKINETDMRIKHIPTGNEIVFAGLDDVEKIKSITFEKGNLTDVWIEEASEVEKESFEQIDLRLRGGDTEYQITMSYNPTSISLWQKDWIDEWIHEPIQIGQLYVKKRVIFDDVTQKEIYTEMTVLRTTYKQNNFLDAPYRAKLESYKEKDPYFYQVYCMGEYGVTGKTVFNAQKLSLRLQEVKQYKLVSGQFKRDSEGIIKWIPDIDGTWIVFKHPEPKRYYVMGADVAEGIEASENQKEGDYSAAQVLDNNTLEQCAVYHDHIDPDTYADELEIAGYYFNTALISVEINMEGGTNRNLERKHYPKLYMREKQDDIAHGIETKFGWRTTETSRRLIISDLIEYVRDHTELINDPYTIDEMLTFIRNKNGRPEGQSGKFDDRVMSFAIALQAALCGQQQKAAVEQHYNTYGFSEDALEDFKNASEDTKKHLAEKWNSEGIKVIAKVNGLTIAKKNGKRVYI